MKILDVFQPNKVLDKNALRILIGTQLAILLFVWSFAHTVFLPRPWEVASAFRDIWNQGLGTQLAISLLLNLEAIALSAVISSLLAYAIVVPFVRPIAVVVSKMRFLSLAGLVFFATLAAKNGHQLKLMLLVFSVTVFYVTSMIDVVLSTPKELYDLGRTLRFGEARVVWESVILGQADKAFDALRQNSAMGWMMLSSIEAISRSEGGIGAMLLTQNKYFNLAAVFAIQICILILGLGQDYAIGWLRRFVCPYADLKLERT